MDEITWKKIISELKPISISMSGLLNSTRPINFVGDKLEIGVYYKFHKDKLEENRNKKILENVFFKVLGKNITYECILKEVPQRSELTDVVNQNIMTAAEEIFS